MFKTIAYDVESERVEKKSRFIANIFYVESENEAEQKIKEIRKKYYERYVEIHKLRAEVLENFGKEFFKYFDAIWD